MCLRRAKFHLNPTTPSIGSPGPITSLPAFPLGRPRSPSISPLGLGDFPAVFFSWSAWANGERETAAIQYPGLPGHELALHQVSSRSVHAFYGLPVPYLFSPGLSDLFHRAPRASTASVASAFSPVFFSWTARANGERETAAIRYPDLSGHKLALHQVSSRSVHAFYRLPPSLSIFPGPFRSFSSSTAGLNGLSRLGLFPGLFLMDGTGKRRGGESGNLTSRPFGATTSPPPSFIPRLPREPPQPTDGQGRVHAT